VYRIFLLIGHGLLPENEPENPAAEEGGPKPSILQLIWIYHPFAMLAMALVIAGFAYSLLPEQIKEEPKPLSYFYNRSLSALMMAKNPLVSESKSNIQVDIQKAKTDLEFIFHHPSYRDQLDNDPELINPYMLYGESLYLYGMHPNITQDRIKTFERAVYAYSEALSWEGKHWDERQQRIYDQQYFNSDETYNERVLAARKLLRRRYLQYMHALSAMKAEKYNLAQESIDNLMHDFRLESLQKTENDSNFESELSDLPPHEFELLPEDRTLLYFQLGQLNEVRKDYKQAEKNYQIFLLNARRSREYFQALMRLGSFYFMDAEKAEDVVTKRRMFGEAAKIFDKVVSASPPGDLLREAYFTGGRAYLNMAMTLPVEEKSIWNKLEDLGETSRERLKTFSGGNTLPERTRNIIPALGRMLTQSGLSTPVPTDLMLKTMGGSFLSLAAQSRLSPMGERKRLLSRAKAFFTGSQGGEDQKFDGASYVMLARTYMVEEEFDKARGLLRYTSSKFWSDDVELACQLGIANSYLLEGDLDRAYVRFIGGVEKITPSLLVEYDVMNWNLLCSQIYQGSREDKLNPAKRIWGFLPDNVQDIIYNATMTGRLPTRYQPILIRRLNEIISREDFYAPDYFKGIELTDTAYLLLQEELPLLKLSDRQWLNRMLVDKSFMQVLIPTAKGEIIKPFISAKELENDTNNILLNKNRVIKSLKALSLAYVDRANIATENNNRLLASDKKMDEHNLRLIAATPRRELEHASKINKFLIDKYPTPDEGVIMMDNAAILQRRARLAGSDPFRNTTLAKRLISEAADAYMEIGMSGKYLDLEPEALLEAGRNFFASGQYGRASEALDRYVKLYERTPDYGRANNLLGRCYWFQGRFLEAADVFKKNALALTDAGRASLYYLGAVYLDAKETTLGNVTTDRIGDPKNPYLQQSDNGQQYPQTALQVFNEIRRLPGITPTSRPWRWATFGLAKTWYEIAERARANELQKAQKEGRTAASIEWLPYYEEAERLLRESLERYKIKYNPNDPIGIDPIEEPEDYNDIMRERMESEYFLAMTLKVLARSRSEMGEGEVRKLLSDVINPELYPSDMTNLDGTRLLLTNRSVLGLTEGPVVRPRYLEALQHNSFFLLAQSWKEYGRELLRENKKTLADNAFDKALQVYRQARDRLTLVDGPRILYNMGEVMISLGKPQDARRLFLMAISQVNQLESSGQKQEIIDELILWRTLSQDRIRDMDNKVGI